MVLRILTAIWDNLGGATISTGELPKCRPESGLLCATEYMDSALVTDDCAEMLEEDHAGNARMKRRKTSFCLMPLLNICSLEDSMFL